MAPYLHLDPDRSLSTDGACCITQVEAAPSGGASSMSSPLMVDQQWIGCRWYTSSSPLLPSNLPFVFSLWKCFHHSKYAYFSQLAYCILSCSHILEYLGTYTPCIIIIIIQTHAIFYLQTSWVNSLYYYYYTIWLLLILSIPYGWLLLGTCLLYCC